MTVPELIEEARKRAQVLRQDNRWSGSDFELATSQCLDDLADALVVLRGDLDKLQRKLKGTQQALDRETHALHEQIDKLTDELESARVENTRLREALERSENDWTFLQNLHPNVALSYEVRRALAAANLKLIRAALLSLPDEQGQTQEQDLGAASGGVVAE